MPLSRTLHRPPSSSTEVARRNRSMSACSAWSSTSIDCTDSRSSAGAGWPPTFRVKATSAIGGPRHVDGRSRLGQQVGRPQSPVGVADAPVALRVPEVALAQQVHAVVFRDDVGQATRRLPDVARALASDDAPAGVLELQLADQLVAAALEERHRRSPTEASVASCSFFFWWAMYASRPALARGNSM